MPGRDQRLLLAFARRPSRARQGRSPQKRRLPGQRSRVEDPQTHFVVLSPHLDDAVLSVGGYISRRAAGGGDVLVATFFTAGPDPAILPRWLRPFGDYDARKAEDRAALGRLGASYRWLDHRERAMREPYMRNPLRVFRTSDDACNSPELGELADEIRALLAAFPAAQVLAPLAVGNHVDHVALFVASLHALHEEDAVDRFRFYEDVYAIGTLARRRHFVTRTRSWHWREAPERTSVSAAVMLSTIALANRGGDVGSCLPRGAGRLSWRCEAIPLGEHESRKLEAVFDYRSQVRALGGEERIERLLRRYHRLWGGGEPLWRAAFR